MAQPLSLEQPLPDDLRDDLRDTFKNAMSSIASPVSVVTTMVDGAPYGTTVSAFVSLSMDPPMLLVSLMQSSRLLGLLRPGAAVGVNVLADNQHEIATRFAQRGEDKFRDVAWRIRDDAPEVVERHAWVAMRVAQLVPAGDHTLVLGDVHAADCGGRDPLTYWRRTFGTHRALTL